MVFATSTSVDEARSDPNFTRHNATIERYNAVALDALRETDTVINDLYPMTTRFPDAFRSDWVHFYTPEATEVIGGRVLSVISELLEIAPAEVNIEGFSPEKYSADTIGY